MIRISKLAAMLCSALMLAGAVHAQTPEPERVILSVKGNVKDSKPMDFTRADLEKLGMATLKTSTPWHNGVQTFEGVPLSAVMKHVGAQGTKAEIVALNKYATVIPLDDLSKYEPLLALKREGEYMPIKDKGPLFVIYPFDARPELKIELYFGRSAWQVRSITVE